MYGHVFPNHSMDAAQALERVHSEAAFARVAHVGVADRSLDTDPGFVEVEAPQGVPLGLLTSLRRLGQMTQAKEAEATASEGDGR